jgi:hypothetical protein
MLKEPWLVFYELYREARAKETHESATVHALTNVVYDWNDRRDTASGEALAGLVTALQAWHDSGVTEWATLRDRLRDAWTDWVLSTRRR